jgi:hypothetical protein
MRDHHEFDSPVDIPREGPGRRPLGWATRTIFVASLFLLITNAVALRGWIDEQPVSPLQARLAGWAAEWAEATSALGLGSPRAEVHRLWKEGEAARFESERPADQR